MTAASRRVPLHPLAANDSPANQARNRRVDIVIVEDGS
jgi:flagellar motor protein MotB